MSNNETEKSFSRRNFLKMSSVATGTLVAGTYLGSLLTEDPAAPAEPDSDTEGQSADGGGNEAAEQADYTKAYKFFQKKEDFQTIEAAAERIFPEDDNGPGATTLEVGWFIDHELAGDHGNNEKEYMKGPFKQGTDFQGPQYAMLRKDIFMEGIRLMNEQAQDLFDSTFIELDGGQQDEILTQLEQNEIDVPGIKSSDFFKELRLITLSGVYADPLYNGNKDMKGWEMKRFPGAYMSYKSEIQKEEFVELEMQSNSAHISH